MGSQVRVHIERHDGSEGRTGNWHRSGSVRATTKKCICLSMGAKTIEVKASHLSLISHPEEITRLIFEAAGQQA